MPRKVPLMTIPLFLLSSLVMFGCRSLSQWHVPVCWSPADNVVKSAHRLIQCRVMGTMAGDNDVGDDQWLSLKGTPSQWLELQRWSSGRVWFCWTRGKTWGGSAGVWLVVNVTFWRQKQDPYFLCSAGFWSSFGQSRDGFDDFVRNEKGEWVAWLMVTSHMCFLDQRWVDRDVVLSDGYIRGRTWADTREDILLQK